MNGRTLPSRRDFLRAGGLAASLGVLGSSILARDAVAAPIGVRRNVGGMAASDPILLTYRKAIQAMKALSPSDPRSWSYQAAIHGTLTTPVQTAWNTCQHNATFFWSWHRMYLYWFERIVRKMAGDCEPCWVLPFWDWASPAQRQLPSMFRDPASELFESNRNPAMNSGAGSLSPAAVDYSAAFALTDFVTAAGSLSNGAHGSVHIGVGGLMSSVPTSAQDPIFYLHHANVDRLWNLWLAQGARSDPLADATWKNTKFTFFDENAFEVQMTSCQVLRAAEQLYYAYEGEPDQVREYCERLRFPWPWIFEIVEVKRFPFPPIELGPKTITVDLSIADIHKQIAALLGAKNQTLLLALDDVIADRPPGIIWEVHLGATGTAEPQVQSPSFLGTMALFGEGIRSEAHGDHGFTPAHFAFRIRGRLLERVAGSADRVPLTFVPRGILIDGKPEQPRSAAAVHIGRVSLSVENQKEAAR
jgi:tyrosinase